MRVKRIFRWSLVILWMIVIFRFSSDIASESSVKSGYIKSILDGLFGWTGIGIRGFAEYGIRKIGHLSEYAILGILFLRAFREEFKVQRLGSYSVTILFVLLYAISDETHQLFVRGRSGQISDVFIDVMGGIMGIIVIIIFEKLNNRVEKVK